MECGLLENVREGWDHPRGVDDIIEWTMEGVEASMPILPLLSDTLHGVRLAARRIISGWWRNGIQARLLDVRLAPYDCWRGSKDPVLDVLVEGLDDLLNTSVQEFRLENEGGLEPELDEVFACLAGRQMARAELANVGASGTIDQLALNAIAHFGNVASTLRRFATERLFWLSDSTALLARDGAVTAGNGTANPAMHIGWRRITVDGSQIPESILVASIGRPITDLVDHYLLSPDMIVSDARSSNDGQGSVTFDLVLRDWLFCSVSGRAWLREPEAVPEALPNNVVALRAR